MTEPAVFASTYHDDQLALVARIPRVTATRVSPDTLAKLEAAFTEFNVHVDIVGSYAGPQVEVARLKTRAKERLKTLRVALPDISLRVGANIRLSPRFSECHVDVEIPRAESSPVSLSDVIFSDINNDVPRRVEAALPWAVGVTATGGAVICDLAQAPHVLISGTTGSGKSAALEAMIMSLVAAVSPDDLEFILVDPKRVSLTPFETLPHVRRDVITDATTVEQLCVRLREEMAIRYEAFQQAGVTDIAGFRAKSETDTSLYAMRRVVVVIDELADLVTAPNGKVIEGHLIALAQMARAAGIHLVCATQRPSAAILSTQLRSQLPTRLVFAVASAMDSRVAMDEAGAEKLCGRGDALLKWAGGTAIRLQGVFLGAGWVPFLVDQTLRETCAGWVRPAMIPLARPDVIHAPFATELTNEQLLKKGAMAMWWMQRLGRFGWIVPAFFM